jgi:hypothetical protein
MDLGPNILSIVTNTTRQMKAIVHTFTLEELIDDWLELVSGFRARFTWGISPLTVPHPLPVEHDLVWIHSNQQPSVDPVLLESSGRFEVLLNLAVDIAMFCVKETELGAIVNHFLHLRHRAARRLPLDCLSLDLQDEVLHSDPSGVTTLASPLLPLDGENSVDPDLAQTVSQENLDVS